MSKAIAQDRTPADFVVRTIGGVRIAGLFAALGFGGALLLTSIQPAEGTRPIQALSAAMPNEAGDPSRFVLNALLVPALDGDALPLRWADPRPIMRCGANTAVLVNGKPLVAGALVPDQPFELEWLADGCRPFGASGARLDGAVKLTVFREDWGFSASVVPAGLRITSAQNQQTTLMRPLAATLPQSGDHDEPVLLTAASARP